MFQKLIRDFSNLQKLNMKWKYSIKNLWNMDGFKISKFALLCSDSSTYVDPWLLTREKESRYLVQRWLDISANITFSERIFLKVKIVIFSGISGWMWKDPKRRKLQKMIHYSPGIKTWMGYSF